jgi:hypothetical protein
MFVEARWKIADRLIAPFGMSLNVAPEWRRIDSATGAYCRGLRRLRGTPRRQGNCAG